MSVKRQIIDLKVALELGGVAAEEIAQGFVRFVLGFEIDAGDGLAAQDAQLLGKGIPVAQGAVEEGVAPALDIGVEVVGCLQPVLVVAPVAVIAVFQLGIRECGYGDEPGGGKGLFGAQRQGAGGLVVFARLVGIGDEVFVVVGRPGIVAIVLVGAEGGQQ